MAETLINNNQIDTANTDKITVAVCNKVFEDLNNTLIQKGVPSNSISADNPTGLVDAVKALPTNTIGSLNKDYPIAFFTDGNTFSFDDFYYDIVDDSILRMMLSANSCYFYDLLATSLPNEESMAKSFSPSLTVNKTLVQNSITEQSLGYTLGNNIVLKCIDNSINLAYISYVNSTTAYCGIITVSKDDWSTITATCIPITFSEDSYTNTFGQGMSINAAKDNKAVINTKSNNDVWGILDLETGIIKTEFASFSSVQVFRYGGGYQAKNYNGVYVFQYSSYLGLLQVDWNTLANSQIKFQMEYEDDYMYGVSQDNNKLYVFCPDSLNIHNILTGSLKTIPLTSSTKTSFLPFTNFPSGGGNFSECLYIEQKDNLTYIYFGGGIIVLDSDDNIVKPVSGSKAVCFGILQDKQLTGSLSMPNYKIRFKYNNSIYECNDSTISFVKIYKNKVLFNFYIRNEQELYYFYKETITKEKMDSTLFDADTVSISVNVRDIGGAQEAGT